MWVSYYIIVEQSGYLLNMYLGVFRQDWMAITQTLQNLYAQGQIEAWEAYPIEIGWGYTLNLLGFRQAMKIFMEKANATATE